MAPRIKPKPSGIAQYKYRPRPAGKTGQKKQNVLHIPGKWFDVLMLCHQWETEHHGRQGAVAAIAKQKGVKYRTLARHWATWKSAIRNEGGNQSLVARVNKENRGGHNRILTPHQERVLCTRLYQYHADCGLVITDKIIIREALLLLNELQADLISRQRVTSLSSGWVSGFKERLGWRSERIAAHPVKPPPVTADVKRFATSAKRFADSIPARLVINLDETKIKQTNKPRSTLRLPKQPYSVNIGEHPTHGETALMGASMSGHKFPIGLIVEEERKISSLIANKPRGSTVFVITLPSQDGIMVPRWLNISSMLSFPMQEGNTHCSSSTSTVVIQQYRYSKRVPRTILHS